MSVRPFTIGRSSGTIRSPNRSARKSGLIGQANILSTNAVYDHLLRVTENRPLPSSHFLLTLEAGSIAEAARPGQFVMLRFPDRRDPLLPRPMSLCNVLPGRIQILHKVVGTGTRLLAALSVGDRIQALGPLGRPFEIPLPLETESGAVMVAGGIGVAIFPFLAPALSRAGWKTTLLFGTRRSAELVQLDWFRQLGVEVRTATEDGSAGRKGLVTALLQEMLAVPGSVGRAYACGPQPMLRAVGNLLNAAAVPCQLSLEAWMACGIGACLGCVVKVRRGSDFVYARTCVEGPTMAATEVLWD